MSPEIWALVARELNTLSALARNWLDEPKAAKIGRHVEVLRALIKDGTGGGSNNRRAALWWKDPTCFWCGRITRLDRRQGSPAAATADHLRSGPGRDRKRDTRRHLPAVVLACYECNHRRGQPRPPPNPMCPLLRAPTIGER